MEKQLPANPIGPALRLLRTRKKLTQTAAGQLAGAPDFRVLSHWERGRKCPSFRLLAKYLAALELDFHDLQDAFDQVLNAPSPMRDRLAELGAQVEDLTERRQVVLERRLLRIERRLDVAGVANLDQAEG